MMSLEAMPLAVIPAKAGNQWDRFTLFGAYLMYLPPLKKGDGGGFIIAKSLPTSLLQREGLNKSSENY